MRLASLQRLAEGMRRAPHVNTPSLQTFPDISIPALERDLRVAERGQENGSRELPTASSESLDEVEYAIVERIFAERKAAHATVVDQLETYAQRLSALDFEGRFTVIRNAAPSAVSEFNAEAQKGRNQLYQLARMLIENEQERDAFKVANSLTKRAPRVPSSTSIMFKSVLLAFLFVSETYVNAVFLAKGAELGLIGGAVEALAFAILNVLFSFGIGFGGVRQINARGFFRKLIGALSILVWLALVALLNLALAHYREVAGTLYADAGTGVISRIWNAPAGLTDIKSWLFFSIGMVWAIIAMIEGVFFTDPYPGYAALQKRVNKAHDDYIDWTNTLIGELQDIRDQASREMEAAQHDLGKRRAMHNAILEGRSRIIQLFKEHQDQLERAGNALLARYRSANRQARSTAAPARFDQHWQMERVSLETQLPEMLLRKSLDDEIKNSDAILSDQIRAIHQAFADALESYRQIDDLVPGDKHAAALKQKA